MLIKNKKWGWVLFWVIVCCIAAILIARWDYRIRNETYETFNHKVWVSGSLPHNVCVDGETSNSFGRGTCSWHGGISHTTYAIPGHYKMETVSRYVKKNPGIGYLMLSGLIGAIAPLILMSLRYLYIRKKA